MSCDDLQGNGHLARAAFATFARLRDPELADWVKREVCFPDSMVDRITPTTTDAASAEVRERFGIDDRWPVVCEPYTQWVLQDAFTAGGRIPKWLVPVIRQQLAPGGEIRRSAAVVASWARYAEGVDEQGQPIEVVDRLADRLIRAARRQCANPTAFIADRDLFGDLADHERFVTAYPSALASLHERGHG
jgi:mannitol-1-phosphate/altronate dehydrogenase